MFFADGEPEKVVDSTEQQFNYAYAPSIILAEGRWHLYFCSSGTGPEDWDNIRYSTSLNGSDWSPPVVILHASDATNERATCDPSVVLYDAGDGAYYYLFYTGNQTNAQSVNFVARSTNASGQFLKLTTRDTWESNPPDPKAILTPLHAISNSAWYGLGQPSVVAKDGKLFQWYTDTSGDFPSHQTSRIYLSVSKDPSTWPSRQTTNVVGGAVDVKYDALADRFVMFELADQHIQGTHLTVRTSKNGTMWSYPTTVIQAGSVPAFAHNVGVSGSPTGELTRNFVMVAYGAPYNLDPDYNNDCKAASARHCWGYWDLYEQRLKVFIR